MKVVGYTSGAQPCGIADYHRKVATGLAAVGVQCDTVPLPTGSVYRDRPVALWKQRRLYAGLAARSGAYDAVLLDLLTHWNGLRAGENTLPAFINHLRGPLLMIVHEWPPVLDPESDSQSLPKRLVTQLAGLAIRLGERKGLPYEEWMAKRVFARADHILVHARVLRDRLLAVGIPEERVTFQIFPIPKVHDRVGSKVVDEFARRFAHRRKIVVFGFPHPRKTLEHAIQALPQMPADVMLMFVGGIEGEFRRHYVRSLQEIASGLGVLDRIEFLGEVPEPSLPFAFELAEFALAPFSYATGSASFSYLIAEGMPIVASNLPEHETLVQDGAGIVIFKTGDVSALAEAVNVLLNDQEGRRRLAAQNRAFAERHTYNNLAALIHDRLEDMMRS